MAEFSINGVAYQSRMIDGETQVLVLKRLLPTFTALLGAKDFFEPRVADHEAEDAGDMASRRSLPDALMPVAREIASLSDADVKFLLDACIDVTARQVSPGGAWVGVRQNGIIQNKADGKPATRIQIAGHVIAENFEEMFVGFGIDLSTVMTQAGG